MKKKTAIVLVALVALGCGDSKPSEQEAAPYRVAIVRYLKEQSMDMEPGTFVSLAAEGDTATAEVQMAAKGVSYGVRPR